MDNNTFPQTPASAPTPTPTPMPEPTPAPAQEPIVTPEPTPMATTTPITTPEPISEPVATPAPATTPLSVQTLQRQPTLRRKIKSTSSHHFSSVLSVEASLLLLRQSFSLLS